jgi:hypothetical protein
MLIIYILIIILGILVWVPAPPPPGGSFLDIYLSTRNVHFALCAPSILKHEMQTPKNGVVTIMLTKRVFGVENL